MSLSRNHVGGVGEEMIRAEVEKTKPCRVYLVNGRPRKHYTLPLLHFDPVTIKDVVDEVQLSEGKKLLLT